MPLSHEDRFGSDIRICRIHGPSTFVDDSGRVADDGICVHCWQEAQSENFVSCPVHGLQPRIPGREGCPIPDCLGKDPGPTEAEVAREAESYNRVWPGGPAVRKNVLDAPPAGPAGERDREAGEGAQSEAAPVLPDDGRGVEDGLPWRDPFLEP